MAEGGARNSPVPHDSRGDAEDGYNGPRDRSGTGGDERARLVKQDGGGERAVRYTDGVARPDSEVAIEEHTDKPEWKAPDGGWGYVVMMSAFLVCFIVDGMTYTFGILLGDLEEAFQRPKSQITLAGSIQVGAYLMIAHRYNQISPKIRQSYRHNYATGPVASAVTNAYGCRKVMIAGSLISSCAYITSCWAPNVTVLIIVYGLVAGIGFGLLYLPSIVAVSMYFDRKRTLATCIALCGSGIGTIVMAPVTELLLSEFNWRWTIFNQAGVLLNGLVCAAMVRPLYFDDGAEEDEEEEEAKQRCSSVGTTQEFEIIEIKEIGRVESAQNDRNAEESNNKPGTRESTESHPRRRRSSSAARRASTDDGHWLVIGRRNRRQSAAGRMSGQSRGGMTIWEAIPGISLTNYDEKWTVVLLEIQRLKEEAEKRDQRRRGASGAVKFPSTPTLHELTASTDNTAATSSAREVRDDRFIQSEPLPRGRAHTIADTHKMSRRRSRWDSNLAHRAPLGLSFVSLADLQLSQSLKEARAQVVRYCLPLTSETVLVKKNN
ncbi:monocarboxylate transporter [Elysia marginata]|uniref:Monocarboxylate transporter n=1 Tax=Elysia marginata TaxID=1093978 RepID=A0AAV4GG67_9GAST|nr:monocarboxylate transporter [Elysia marginata]